MEATMANWSLWSGCLITVGTVTAGWLAYNSVAHDSASHEAMTLHRNWAIPTAITFLFAGLWTILLAKKNRRPGFLFLTYSGLAGLVLMVTSWLGAEAVFRYGLGVKSLPKVEAGEDGHNHSHGGGAIDGHTHREGILDGHDHKQGSDSEHSDDPIESKLGASAENHNHSHESGASDRLDHKHDSDTDHPDDSTVFKSETGTDAHSHSHDTDSDQQNDSSVKKLTEQETNSKKDETDNDANQHSYDEGNVHQHDSTDINSHDHGLKSEKELEQHAHAMAKDPEKSIKSIIPSDLLDHSHNEGASHQH
jgi:uncharacterized membrane protein